MAGPKTRGPTRLRPSQGPLPPHERSSPDLLQTPFRRISAAGCLIRASDAFSGLIQLRHRSRRRRRLSADAEEAVQEARPGRGQTRSPGNQERASGEPSGALLQPQWQAGRVRQRPAAAIGRYSGSGTWMWTRAQQLVRPGRTEHLRNKSRGTVPEQGPYRGVTTANPYYL